MANPTARFISMTSEQLAQLLEVPHVPLLETIKSLASSGVIDPTSAVPTGTRNNPQTRSCRFTGEPGKRAAMLVVAAQAPERMPQFLAAWQDLEEQALARAQEEQARARAQEAGHDEDDFFETCCTVADMVAKRLSVDNGVALLAVCSAVDTCYGTSFWDAVRGMMQVLPEAEPDLEAVSAPQPAPEPLRPLDAPEPVPPSLRPLDLSVPIPPEEAHLWLTVGDIAHRMLSTRQKINAQLQRAVLQYRDRDGWHPTREAEGLCRPYLEKKSNGKEVVSLRWRVEILDRLVPEQSEVVPIERLLKHHKIAITGRYFYKLAQTANLLRSETEETPEHKKVSYKVLVDPQWGKNVPDSKTERSTQPLWYPERFFDLLDYLGITAKAA
jgi:phage regulator Rha-like protein